MEDQSSAPQEKMYPPLPTGESQPAPYPPPQEKTPLTAEAYPPQQGQQPPPYHSDQAPPQQAPAPVVTVVTQQPIVTQVSFGERPVTYTDGDGSQVVTRIEYRSGVLTWLIFGLVCLFTGCICLAVIPFCIDETKDVYHINPNNGAVVGVYKRM